MSEKPPSTIAFVPGRFLLMVALLLAYSGGALYFVLTGIGDIKGDVQRVVKPLERVERRVVRVKPLCIEAGSRRDCERALEGANRASLTRLCHVLSDATSDTALDVRCERLRASRGGGSSGGSGPPSSGGGSPPGGTGSPPHHQPHHKPGGNHHGNPPGGGHHRHHHHRHHRPDVKVCVENPLLPACVKADLPRTPDGG